MSTDSKYPSSEFFKKTETYLDELVEYIEYIETHVRDQVQLDEWKSGLRRDLARLMEITQARIEQGSEDIYHGTLERILEKAQEEYELCEIELN